MDGVDRLLAHEAIRQLVARYAIAVDSGDLDTVVQLFVDDVRVSATERGREALRRFLADQTSEMTFTISHLGTHLIEVVDEHRARGVLYSRAEFQHGDEWIIQFLQYRDDYERRDGHWYFRRRQHLLFYGCDMLRRPIDLEPANWPISHIGGGDLPAAWSTWSFAFPGVGPAFGRADGEVGE